MYEYSPIGLSTHVVGGATVPESYRESHVGRGHEYDANIAASPFDDYLSRAENVYLGRVLGAVLPARIGRYLDFACGTGRITSQLESRADESVGVDVSASMLQAARTRCRFTQFVQADLTRDDHELTGFDVVTAFRFFGNAEAALRGDALRAINRCLRAGGHLILNNHRNPYSLARLAHRLTGGRHRATLSHFELRALLAKSGFRIVWQRPIGAWLYRTGLFGKLRAFDPAAWPEHGFGAAWLAPFAPNAIIVAVKTHAA
jgi:predicted TPR repeat methyltransferase